MEREIIHIALADGFRDKSREEKRRIGGTGKMLGRNGSIIAGGLNFSCNPTTILHTMLVLNIKRVQSNFS